MSEGNGASRPGPVIAKDNLRAPLAKRFYKDVSIAACQSGWRILLDGRAVKTPAKRDLALPSKALAAAVAAEWNAQGPEIAPATMPLTRIVNSALDGVTDRCDDVIADIAKYSARDLLCYRADAPAGLVAAQERNWDPVLACAEREFNVRFARAVGIMPVEQPEGVAAAVTKALQKYSPLALAALHVMTTLTGSAILALAHAHGRLTAEAAWNAAHVDEDWQISQWGNDAEATERRAKRWLEMEAAAKILALAHEPPAPGKD